MSNFVIFCSKIAFEITFGSKILKRLSTWCPTYWSFDQNISRWWVFKNSEFQFKRHQIYVSDSWDRTWRLPLPKLHIGSLPKNVRTTQLISFLAVLIILVVGGNESNFLRVFWFWFGQTLPVTYKTRQWVLRAWNSDFEPYFFTFYLRPSWVEFTLLRLVSRLNKASCFSVPGELRASDARGKGCSRSVLKSLAQFWNFEIQFCWYFSSCACQVDVFAFFIEVTIIKLSKTAFQSNSSSEN